MNITILTTQLGGTGGAINCIAIANKFVEEGHKVEVFSEQAPDKDISKMLKVEVKDIKDAPPEISSDVGIAFNLTGATKKALYSVKGKKFARLGIIAPEYEDVIMDKNIFKILTVSYDKLTTDAFHQQGSSVVIPGPVDTTNFYPEQIIRSRNIVLTYIKKSGWIGITAINMAQDKNKDLIFASLTDDGIDSSPVKSRYPIAILGCPAHMRAFMRYCYNRVGMFVDTHSNGSWGWNCTVGEAMLCKCPVVGTNSPVFSDIIIDGKTALTSQHDDANELPSKSWKTRPDPEKISNHILTIYENPKLASTLAENAYENVKKFDINFWYLKFMGVV